MTEAQAWREVAERMDRRRSGDYLGLCFEISLLYDDAQLISWNIKRAMRRRVVRHVGSKWEFAYPPSTECEARILAALWLALEAEDEDT